MKTLTFSLFLTIQSLYAIPEPGDSVADQSFSLSPSTSGNTLENLSNSMLSNYEGKVVVVAYFTPW